MTPRWLLATVTLGLFLVWSNTFLAFEVLLAPRTGPAPLPWFGLVVARFAPVAVLCAAWCLCARARESWAILRAHPLRLLACGLLAVPVYNGFLYHAMQARVAGPIASLLTSLSPLYLLILGVLFLREPLTWRKGVGLALGLAGVTLVATARDGGGESGRGWPIFEAAMTPLSWSLHSVLTRPVVRERSPLLWTWLVLVIGTLALLPAVPFLDMGDLSALGPREWGLVAYLGLAATIGGFAVWAWLLRHLPASTAGLTIFLNPPLTLLSKTAIAALFPASFAVHIAAGEWLGGAVMLAGVALAVVGSQARPATSEPPAARLAPSEVRDAAGA